VVVLAGTALLGIGLDQATKALTVATVEGGPPVHLIGRRPRPSCSPASRWQPSC
jgi:hypothetical protein